MSEHGTILVIDDEEIMREILHELLVQEGYEVRLASSGSEGLDICRSVTFDAAIVDIMMPDMDGISVLDELKRLDEQLPVLMITAFASVENAIASMKRGAFDYITKPFKMAVLLARLRAQLRQHALSEDASFTLGPYTFQPAHKILTAADGQKVRLTEKETNILKFLLRAGAVIVPREKLLHEVWGYNAAVTTHTLETHIYRLRQKIEVDPSQACLLVTAAGGYKLVA